MFQAKNSPFPRLLMLCGLFITVTFVFSYLSYMVQTNRMPSGFAIWNQWDTPHYLKLADHGYRADGPEKFFIVFFPLYPLLVHLFTYIFREPMLAALIVGNLAYCGAAIYLYYLTRLDFDEDTAFRSFLLFSFFPSAFSLHMAYTDSTYLVCLLASFYSARKSQWVPAVLWGCAAAFAKVVGFLIFIPLCAEYLHQKNWDFKKVRPAAFLLLLPVLPFLCHAGLSYSLQGDAFNFIKFQHVHWGQKLSWPWDGLFAAWKGLFWRHPSEKVTVGFWELLSGLLAYFFIFFSWKKLRPSYTIYILIMVVALTSKNFWMSLSRHILYLFPIFIGLGILTQNKTARAALFFFCIVFYGLFLGLFVQGKWAF